MGVSKTDKEWRWGQASKIRSENPNLWRRDEKDNAIYKPAYGAGGEYGWSVDHRNPVSKGGTDHRRNLRALHMETNKRMGNRRKLR